MVNMRHRIGKDGDIRVINGLHKIPDVTRVSSRYIMNLNSLPSFEDLPRVRKEVAEFHGKTGFGPDKETSRAQSILRSAEDFLSKLSTGSQNSVSVICDSNGHNIVSQDVHSQATEELRKKVLDKKEELLTALKNYADPKELERIGNELLAAMYVR